MDIGIFDHLDRGGKTGPPCYEERIRIAEAFQAADFYFYHMAEHHFTTLGMAPSPSIFLEAIKARPATVAAYAKDAPLTAQPVSEEERKRNLYGQTAANTAARIGSAPDTRDEPKPAVPCQRPAPLLGSAKIQTPDGKLQASGDQV